MLRSYGSPTRPARTPSPNLLGNFTQARAFGSAVATVRHRRRNNATRLIPEVLVFNGRQNLLSGSFAPRGLGRYAANVRRTVSIHPGTTTLFLDDKGCADTLLSHREIGAALAQAFRNEADGRLRSDMCRLAQLYRHGGYYFDNDIAPLFDLRRIIDADTTFVTALTTTAFPQNPRGFFQAFLGAAPGHPVLDVALRRHLRWYDAKARRDAAEIRRVTRGNTRPNVGTVLLRDAFLEWAGGSALAEAEAGGRVSHGSRHASQLLFEAPRSSLGAAYNASRLRRASPLCAFVVADRRSRRVGLISRVFDQNAGVSCLR